MHQQLTQPMVCAAIVTEPAGKWLLVAPMDLLYAELESIADECPMSARIFEVASYS